MRARNLLIIITAIAAQGCGPQFKVWRVDDRASKSACDMALIEQFESTYHPLLRATGCHNCHAPNRQKADAPFAQEDVWAAFNDFKRRGPQRIQDRVAEGHNQSVLGYSTGNLMPVLEAYKSDWETVEATCALGMTAVLTDAQTSQIFDPAGIDDLAKCGLGDPLRADHLNFQVITWDLGLFRPDLAGVTLKISVKAEEPANIAGQICAHKGYRAGNAVIASPKSLKLKNLKILLNGENYDVNTFMVERAIPAGSTAFQLINSSSGGFGIFDSGSAKAADKWSVIIEKLEILP